MSRRARLCINLVCCVAGFLSAQGVMHLVVCGINLRCQRVPK